MVSMCGRLVAGHQGAHRCCCFSVGSSHWRRAPPSPGNSFSSSDPWPGGVFIYLDGAGSHLLQQNSCIITTAGAERLT